MIAYHLTTEHMKDPTGIDRNHPQLYWKCSGGLRQSAYRIRSASALEDLDREKLIWDSGEVLSDESLNIEYAADTRTGDRICWQVRLKDEQLGFISPALFIEKPEELPIPLVIVVLATGNSLTFAVCKAALG